VVFSSFFKNYVYIWPDIEKLILHIGFCIYSVYVFRFVIAKFDNKLLPKYIPPIFRHILTLQEHISIKNLFSKYKCGYFSITKTQKYFNESIFAQYKWKFLLIIYNFFFYISVDFCCGTAERRFGNTALGKCSADYSTKLAIYPALKARVRSLYRNRSHVPVFLCM
jgi:hypothetical protein